MANDGEDEAGDPRGVRWLWRRPVTEAHARGHEVIAVVRGSSTLTEREGVVVKRGSLEDAAFLAEAIAGCHAVVSALGLRGSGFSPFAKVEDIGILGWSSR